MQFWKIRLRELPIVDSIWSVCRIDGTGRAAWPTNASRHSRRVSWAEWGRRRLQSSLLELTTLDDLYEPDLAFVNTRQLIDNHRVFALIGEVGTATSRSAASLAGGEDATFITPFTGAEFLRSPGTGTVVNLRASNYQETEEMVARLTEDLGITRIAVMYQNDSYGQAGLDGVLQALERRGLEITASWFYQRNAMLFLNWEVPGNGSVSTLVRNDDSRPCRLAGNCRVNRGRLGDYWRPQ